MIFASIFSNFNWYGFFIASAMLIGICAAYFLAKSRGYHEDLVFYVAIICIPCAIVGARLYYVIFDDHGASYWSFQKIIGWENGKFQLSGLAIYGGIIGAVLASLIVYKIFSKKENPLDRITILQMFDLFFIFIVLGQAIGRWGNYVNEEAFGSLVTNPDLQWFPISVKIDGQWHYATFFYESMSSFVCFGLMLWAYIGKRKSFDGFVFSLYTMWYGITRFIIEQLRTDSLYIFDIRVSQWLSVPVFLIGAVILFSHIISAKEAGKKPFIMVPQQKLSTDYYNYEKSRVSLPKRVYEKKTKE